MNPLSSEDAWPVKIHLIERDPIESGWLRELIEKIVPSMPVTYSTAFADAGLVLAQQPIDAVFLSMHNEQPSVLIQGCRDLIGRIGGRPLVALLDPSQKIYAEAVRKAGATLVYVKHPIMRAGFIRKQALREQWECVRTRA